MMLLLMIALEVTLIAPFFKHEVKVLDAEKNFKKFMAILKISNAIKSSKKHLFPDTILLIFL